MLPPPITAPISTPRLATVATSSTIISIVWRLMPKGSSPISASPESLRRTRLYFGCDIFLARRSRLGHHFRREVARLLLDPLADHQEAVGAELGLLLGQRFLHRQFVVHHERLAE